MGLRDTRPGRRACPVAARELLRWTRLRGQRRFWHAPRSVEAADGRRHPTASRRMARRPMHVPRAEKGYPIIGQDTDGTVSPHDLRHDVGRRRSSTSSASIVQRRKPEPIAKGNCRASAGRSGNRAAGGCRQIVESARRRAPPPPVPMLGHVIELIVVPSGLMSRWAWSRPARPHRRDPARARRRTLSRSSHCSASLILKERAEMAEHCNAPAAAVAVDGFAQPPDAGVVIVEEAVRHDGRTARRPSRAGAAAVAAARRRAVSDRVDVPPITVTMIIGWVRRAGR